MKRFKGKIKDLKGKRYGDLSNDIKEKLLYQYSNGKLIEETENHIIRTITNDEFNNAFGCVYPYY